MTVPVLVAGDNTSGSQEPMGEPGHEEAESVTNGADKRETTTAKPNGVEGQKKKKKRKKAATAMPKNRGTGFEGTV